ncbi:MAG: universal stress protein [Pseudomonadota bacterium]|nr:universal stress protein [Pseudomonadota bacterium]
MKILLASDGSESARAAVDCLLRFPFPPDSQVKVLTVIDRELFKGEDASELNDEQQHALQETEKVVQEAAQELLAREAARLRNAGWPASSKLRIGHPAEEIVRVAEQLDSDCVIVGSHGMSGIKRFLLGSVSDHVLRYAPCSVLIVKNPAVSSYESGNAPTSPAFGEHAQPLRMLLAYDNSVPARKAVEFCASLPLDEQAEVTALTILPLVTLYRQDIRQRLSWLWLEKKKQALAALEGVTKEIGRATPHVEGRLREAPDVSDEILHAAAEYRSDLIVLGHKGKGAIRNFLLGSVTTRIAHHASCSVLAVRNS